MDESVDVSHSPSPDVRNSQPVHDQNRSQENISGGGAGFRGHVELTPICLQFRLINGKNSLNEFLYNKLN